MISLINADTKIVSLALAKCIDSILPDLIHLNQNACVKGSGIFDTVGTILYIEDIKLFVKFCHITKKLTNNY